MASIAIQDGRLKLDLFEGPLDLLLYLIRKHEVDVHDIPIVSVTSQYQAMLEEARRDGLLDLDFAGDYFLMAATLIQIKSRLLLPRDEGAEGEEDEDPRRELVQQLLEYERFREAAMLLQERAELTATMHARSPRALERDQGFEGLLEVDLLALAKAFRQVMEDKRLRTPHVFSPSRFSVGDRIRHLLGRLGDAEAPVDFRELFEQGTIEECVVTFLALLELVKRGFLRCRQAAAEAPILLSLVPVGERPDGGVAAAASEFDAPFHDQDEGGDEGEGADEGAGVDDGVGVYDGVGTDEGEGGDEGEGAEEPSEEPRESLDLGVDSDKGEV